MRVMWNIRWRMAGFLIFLGAYIAPRSSARSLLVSALNQAGGELLREIGRGHIAGNESLRHATHRHRKGGLYRLIARGRIEATLEPCAIYASLKNDLVWVRPEAEFEDGHFDRLVPEDQLPGLLPLPEKEKS